MDVGLSHLLNRKILLSRILRVALEIAHGVDDDGLSFRRDNVGILGQSCHFELLDFHRFACPWCPANSSNWRRLF